MNLLWSVYQYFKYFIRSNKRGHGIHSPFVYQFVKEVIDNKDNYYLFEDIESLRAKLLLTDLEIEVTDLGAGSKVQKSTKRKISKIAETALKPKKQAELLFKIAKYFNIKNAIELGTSLGISSLYLSQYSKECNLTTIEGCPNIAKVAQLNFEKLKANNIQSIVGSFEENLPKILSNIDQLDLVYFDGNHTEEATLKYFEICKQYIHNDSIFIFDDLYWSKEMLAAWNKIKADSDVKITIDIYHFGLVFFRKEQPKENFTVYH